LEKDGRKCGRLNIKRRKRNRRGGKGTGPVPEWQKEKEAKRASKRRPGKGISKKKLETKEKKGPKCWEHFGSR